MHGLKVTTSIVETSKLPAVFQSRAQFHRVMFRPVWNFVLSCRKIQNGSGSDAPKDYDFKFVRGLGVTEGSNLADNGSIPDSYTVKTFGGTEILGGLTWTWAQLVDAYTGCIYKVRCTDTGWSGNSWYVYVDVVKLYLHTTGDTSATRVGTSSVSLRPIDSDIVAAHSQSCEADRWPRIFERCNRVVSVIKHIRSLGTVLLQLLRDHSLQIRSCFEISNTCCDNGD